MTTHNAPEHQDTDPAFFADTDPNLGRGDISAGSRFAQNALMAMDTFMPHVLSQKLMRGPRDRVQRSVQAQLEKKKAGVIVPIPRRRNLDPEEFYREYLRKGVPVVMEGAANDWVCRKKWTMQYFADRYGDDEITVTTGEVQTSSGSVRTAVTLRDVIENKDQSDMKYLRFHPLIAIHPELADDIPFDWFEKYKGRKSMFSQSQFFIGTQGTATGMHNSQLANLFAMVSGEKDWFLFPTSYTALMDPPVTHSVYRLSRHNTGQVVEPAYAKLDGYRVHLKAGDVLWNPPFYWHSVCNLTDTIGVGYRWNDYRLSVKMHPMMWFLDNFARDPSWYTMIKACREENRKERSRLAAKAQVEA